MSGAIMNKIWGRRNKLVAMPQPQQIKMVI